MTRNPSVLISNGLVIQDPSAPVLRTDLLVEDGRIAALAPAIDSSRAEIVIDASSHVVMPGLIDTHRHSWQSQFKAMAADWTLNQYLAGVRSDIGVLYRPEDVYAGTLLGVGEALAAGTTTVLDWSHIMNDAEYADAAIAALQATGGRTVLGHGTPTDTDMASWYIDSPREHPRDIVRIRSALPEDGLVTLAMAARGPDRSTMDVTRADWRLARELGIRISIHVGVGAQGRRSRGVSRLSEEGLLGQDITYIHANTTTDDELRMIADSGGSLSIAPAVEMMMGLGHPPIDRALAAGIDPSLSLDVVVGVATGDMFNVMRSALAAGRSRINERALEADRAVDDVGLTTRDVLRFATVAGAEAIGLGDRIGKLHLGYDADLILIRNDGIDMAPSSDPIASVVLAGHPRLVDTVLVRGRIVKRDGAMVSFDERSVIRQATTSRDRLLTAAGIATDGTWSPDQAMKFSGGFG